MKKINVLLMMVMTGFLFASCNKDNNASTQYSIRMTDAPGPYTAVYIDLQGIEITGNNGNAVMLNVNAGIYDLIKLSNGIDTLIASGSMEVSSVQQIRLILGTNNSVVVGTTSYPLSTPSADQSGLKLQVHQAVQAGVVYSVLLDFDANKSIVETGNNTYKLKPVIRTVETAISGSIKGKIVQSGTLAIVTATSSTGLTYTSNVNAAGDFVLVGIPAGIYSVTVTPVLPLLPVIKTNVTVTTGVTTNTGIITIL